MTTALIAYAEEKGRRPSEIYEDFLAHKKDYHLIFSWRAYKAEMEEEARKKAELEQKRRQKFG